MTEVADLVASAPLAVRSTRQLVQTEDWAEGVRATAERREPEFVGQ
jgi:hypothetical protein